MNKLNTMGGCRCIFRDCNVNSNKTSGNVHFFHFPVKDQDKLRLWVKYSKAEKILKLSASQMKNKVVCNSHFRDACFMNYKKDRLTRQAIPTLVRLPGGMVLDYETSDNPVPIKLPITIEKHLVPPNPFAGIKSIDVQESYGNIINEDEFLKDSLLYLEGESAHDAALSAPVVTDIKTCQNNIFTVITVENPFEQKTTEIAASTSNLSKIKNLKRERDRIFDKAPLILNTVTKRYKASSSSNSSSTVTATLLNKNSAKQNKSVPLIRKLERPSENDKCYIDKSASSGAVVDVNKIVKVYTESEVNALLNKCKAEYEYKIKDLEEKLQAKEAEISKVTQEQTVTTSKQQQQVPAASGQSTPLSKAQLFNGVKKYVCPSMSSLVRMEMFGGPEREWKPDEKQASIELLQLGDNVFNYFRDEWRFRLPPKKDVQKWISASADIKDEEDL